jgi:hypothetical protein
MSSIGWPRSSAAEPIARKGRAVRLSPILGIPRPGGTVPSTHVAFALTIGVPLARHRVTRSAPGMYPLLVTLVIVATANHLIDAVSGGLAAAPSEATA